MLEKKDLKKISAIAGVPPDIVEKDIALSVALIKIAQSNLTEKIIFKGGTAIRKIYFEHARFSEDLDFSIQTGITKNVILSEFTKLFSNTTMHGIQFSEVKEEKTTAGLKLRIKFFGPLEYWQSIRIDCNFRENLVQKPINGKIIDTYHLGHYIIPTMPLEEIFAEKMHALSSRAAPRDLYDIAFLLKNNVQLDSSLVEKKLAYYGEKFDKIKIEKNIDEMRINWKRDLERLLKPLPEYEKTAHQVKQALHAV